MVRLWWGCGRAVVGLSAAVAACTEGQRAWPQHTAGLLGVSSESRGVQSTVVRQDVRWQQGSGS